MSVVMLNPRNDKTLGPHKDAVTYSRRGETVYLRHGRIEKLTKTEIADLDGTMAMSGQTIIVHAQFPIKPMRAVGYVGFNPELLKHGEVSVSPVLSPESPEGGLQLRLKVQRQIDLKDLDWVFSVMFLQNV